MHRACTQECQVVRMGGVVLTLPVWKERMRKECVCVCVCEERSVLAEGTMLVEVRVKEDNNYTVVVGCAHFSFTGSREVEEREA